MEYITKTGFLMQMHWSQFLLWEWLIVAISLRLSFAESKVDSEAEAVTKWESRFYKNVRIQLDLPPSSPKTLLSSIVLICSGKGDVDQNVISTFDCRIMAMRVFSGRFLLFYFLFWYWFSQAMAPPNTHKFSLPHKYTKEGLTSKFICTVQQRIQSTTFFFILLTF